MKKNNSDFFRIKKLYETLTNIVITKKEGENKEDVLIGEYHMNGLKQEEPPKNSKDKVLIFQIKKKRDHKDNERWMIKTDNKGEKHEKCESPHKFYNKCIQSFSC